MILEKLEYHFLNKKYAKIVRTVGKNEDIITHGFVLAYNKHFVLLQEVYDFSLWGYLIFPVDQIKKVRYNRFDKCLKKILKSEGELDKVGISYPVNIDTWQSIFSTIKARGLNVTVKCEQKTLDTFTIGPIIKVTKKKVHIQYFDATGLLDDEPTKIELSKITVVCFDDNYINVFSKYLRHRKSKKTELLIK